MEEFNKRIEQLKTSLHIEEKKKKADSLRNELRNEDTWKDWEKGNSISKELSTLEKEIEDFEMLYLYLDGGDNNLITSAGVASEVYESAPD